SCCLFAETTNDEIVKLSEALGHLIGKNIEQLELPLDLKALAKGLQDEMAGKESPLNEEECMQEIAVLKKKQTEQSAKKNLFEAETFLRKNEKNSDISSLEEGKVQYQITREGTGEPVEPYNSPIIRYSVRTLRGESQETSPREELLCLDEALPGLRLGIPGMKEGEARTIYIHPDLGYGKEGHPPNALLIFEVEVIRADGQGGAKTTATQKSPFLDLPDTPIR
ncbi:MAG: FKBP-type peptidyl-prolyl cis-trans isomerase, partial [Verrucomicrobiota bacterium]|nr:FKBP-type peptidyl-prolyl cis-trans isomerase [Verrucomicrobiota bacterium]